ncbi:CCR4-NOT transcription complex subunit 1 like protein, partial [Aduncisulcus paluster]
MEPGSTLYSRVEEIFQAIFNEDKPIDVYVQEVEKLAENPAVDVLTPVIFYLLRSIWERWVFNPRLCDFVRKVVGKLLSDGERYFREYLHKICQLFERIFDKKVMTSDLFDSLYRYLEVDRLIPVLTAITQSKRHELANYTVQCLLTISKTAVEDPKGFRMLSDTSKNCMSWYLSQAASSQHTDPEKRDVCLNLQIRMRQLMSQPVRPPGSHPASSSTPVHLVQRPMSGPTHPAPTGSVPSQTPGARQPTLADTLSMCGPAVTFDENIFLAIILRHFYSSMPQENEIAYALCVLAQKPSPDHILTLQQVCSHFSVTTPSLSAQQQQQQVRVQKHLQDLQRFKKTSSPTPLSQDHMQPILRGLNTWNVDVVGHVLNKVITGNPFDWNKVFFSYRAGVRIPQIHWHEFLNVFLRVFYIASGGSVPFPLLSILRPWQNYDSQITLVTAFIDLYLARSNPHLNPQEQSLLTGHQVIIPLLEVLDRTQIQCKHVVDILQRSKGTLDPEKEHMCQLLSSVEMSYVLVVLAAKETMVLGEAKSLELLGLTKNHDGTLSNVGSSITSPASTVTSLDGSTAHKLFRRFCENVPDAVLASVGQTHSHIQTMEVQSFDMTMAMLHVCCVVLAKCLSFFLSRTSPSLITQLTPLSRTHPMFLVDSLVCTYNIAPNSIGRLLDVAYDLRLIPMILGLKGERNMMFVNDVVALSSQRKHVNLTMWLNMSILNVGAPFVKSVLDYLRAKIQKNSKVSEAEITPQTAASFFSVLAAHLRWCRDPSYESVLEEVKNAIPSVNTKIQKNSKVSEAEITPQTAASFFSVLAAHLRWCRDPSYESVLEEVKNAIPSVNSYALMNHNTLLEQNQELKARVASELTVHHLFLLVVNESTPMPPMIPPPTPSDEGPSDFCMVSIAKRLDTFVSTLHTLGRSTNLDDRNTCRMVVLKLLNFCARGKLESISKYSVVFGRLVGEFINDSATFLPDIIFGLAVSLVLNALKSRSTTYRSFGLSALEVFTHRLAAWVAFANQVLKCEVPTHAYILSIVRGTETSEPIKLRQQEVIDCIEPDAKKLVVPFAPPKEELETVDTTAKAPATQIIPTVTPPGVQAVPHEPVVPAGPISVPQVPAHEPIKLRQQEVIDCIEPDAKKLVVPFAPPKEELETVDTTAKAPATQIIPTVTPPGVQAVPHEPVVPAGPISVPQVPAQFEPTEHIKKRVNGYFNRVTPATACKTGAKLGKELNAVEYQWFASVLVERCCTSSHSQAFVELLRGIDKPDLLPLVLGETLMDLRRNLQKVANTSSASMKESLRDYLQKLGAWLGYLTIAEKRPLFSADLDIPSVFMNCVCYETVAQFLSFLRGLLSSCRDNPFLLPTSSWCMGILGMLKGVMDMDMSAYSEQVKMLKAQRKSKQEGEKEGEGGSAGTVKHLFGATLEECRLLLEAKEQVNFFLPGLVMDNLRGEHFCKDLKVEDIQIIDDISIKLLQFVRRHVTKVRSQKNRKLSQDTAIKAPPGIIPPPAAAASSQGQTQVISSGTSDGSSQPSGDDVGVTDVSGTNAPASPAADRVYTLPSSIPLIVPHSLLTALSISRAKLTAKQLLAGVIHAMPFSNAQGQLSPMQAPLITSSIPEKVVSEFLALNPELSRALFHTCHVSAKKLMSNFAAKIENTAQQTAARLVQVDFVHDGSGDTLFNCSVSVQRAITKQLGKATLLSP